jgi:hypothetical protein
LDWCDVTPEAIGVPGGMVAVLREVLDETKFGANATEVESAVELGFCGGARVNSRSSNSI